MTYQSQPYLTGLQHCNCFINNLEFVTYPAIKDNKTSECNALKHRGKLKARFPQSQSLDRLKIINSTIWAITL